jgi:hypothetical protein
MKPSCIFFEISLSLLKFAHCFGAFLAVNGGYQVANSPVLQDINFSGLRLIRRHLGIPTPLPHPHPVLSFS